MEKFIIEVEKGETECAKCPYSYSDGEGYICVGCAFTNFISCSQFDFNTIKVNKVEE